MTKPHDDVRYRCEVLADSIGPHGHRLTTFEVCFPQMVLRDFTRHRRLSYSFESTRAVPLEARIEEVRKRPFMPIMRERATGMSRGKLLGGLAKWEAEFAWLRAARAAADQAEQLVKVEKGIAGRLLEPFLFITGIVSGTEWDNFFNLRCHPAAQYELDVIARMMRAALDQSVPASVEYGDWHLPLVTPHERAVLAPLEAAKVSAGRCASVSYLKHHTPANDSLAALDRWENKLAPSAHWSPGEHPAKCVRDSDLGAFAVGTGNFDGWLQLRKHYPNEAVAQNPE